MKDISPVDRRLVAAVTGAMTASSAATRSAVDALHFRQASKSDAIALSSAS